jgi:bifunctional non-homologous end joining protein LigD
LRSKASYLTCEPTFRANRRHFPRRSEHRAKALRLAKEVVSGRTDWTPRSGGLSSLEPRSEKNLPAGAFYFCKTLHRPHHSFISAPVMLLRVRTRPALGIIEPCLPSPAKAPPSGPGWLHELKHDGFRILARRDSAGVQLITRAGNDFSSRFPFIAMAVSKLPVRSCLIDGEAIVCDENGLAVFELIRRHGALASAVLCAFDLLELDGKDLRRQPIEERKRLLAKLLRGSNLTIVLNETFEEDGAIVYREACRLGCEGIVSKRLGSIYRRGRSPLLGQGQKSEGAGREARSSLPRSARSTACSGCTEDRGQIVRCALDTRSLGHKGAARKTAPPSHFLYPRSLNSLDLFCLSSSLSIASDERPSTIPMTEWLAPAFATITCTGLLVAQ